MAPTGLNLGDAYTGGGRRQEGDTPESVGGLSGKSKGVFGARPQPMSAHGLPAKNLMGQPWRAAFALQEDGADVNAMRAIERAQDAILDAYDGFPPPIRVRAALDALHAEYAAAKGNSWYLRSAIVWHKPNPMPESVSDRLHQPTRWCSC